ncbi:hypothetical protein D1815_02460 [Aquimarina sp. AD1]|uniref:hypothetical protein n=1 Tax=Aquimarina sp. (strain AD1) TaxID=1714848 RepID=UPI000E4E62AF|nr:hypothetical protein [Aquimarina sp. AD1]AXT54669.1 hypothetical protein D1815_02460 [Aquimarina sp. AD1]RKN19230.1 hypothetical protein D7035_13960 [Aquimarina sp. AD1]
MINKTIFNLIFIVTFFNLSFSQVIVFKNFSDFSDKKGEFYDDYLGYKQSNSNFKLVLKKQGKKYKIDPEEIWGFVYKDALFRMDIENGGKLPVRVISVGKLVYYENGKAHLDMLLDDSSEGSYSRFDGYSCYISQNLNSNLTPIGRWSTLVKRIRLKKKLKAFRKENPEHESFFKCLRNYKMETIRRCISEYEK